VFILQALLATTLLNSSWGKQITAALEPWRVRFQSSIRGMFVSFLDSGFSKVDADAAYKTPNPNSATTSFVGAATYNMGT
jgi:hypothetical protein